MSKFKPGDKVFHQCYPERICTVVALTSRGNLLVEDSNGNANCGNYPEEWQRFIPTPRTVSGWVNIYKDDRLPVLHKTKDAADLYSHSECIACIYVSGEEGKEP